MSSRVRSGDIPPLLEALRGKLKVGPPGHVSYSANDDIDSDVAALSSTLGFRSDVPADQRQKFTYSAVVEAIRAETSTPKDILDRVRRRENEYLAVPSSPYVFVTTLSLRFSERLRQRRLPGAAFVFSRSLPSHFDLPDSDRPPLHYGEPPTEYTTVRVTVSARCSSSAFRKALDSLDLLRGIWNLFYGYKSFREASGRSKFRPMNQIVLGPVYSLHRPDGSLADFPYSWWDPFYVEPQRPCLIDQRYDGLRRYELDVRKKLQASPFERLLTRTLLHHVRALDHRDPAAAFSRLWAVLESLTFTGSNDNHATTVNRASAIYPDFPYRRAALDYLRRQRNAHTHILEEEEDHPEADPSGLVNLLKIHVEGSWRFLLDLKSDLKDEKEYVLLLKMLANPEAFDRHAVVYKRALNLIGP